MSFYISEISIEEWKNANELRIEHVMIICCQVFDYLRGIGTGTGACPGAGYTAGSLLESRALRKVLPALFSSARRPIPLMSMYTSPTFRAVPATYSDDSSACGPYLQSKYNASVILQRAYMRYIPDLLVPHDSPDLLRARIKYAARGVVERR